MTDDEWQAHVTREAAKAIGEWLEGRGRLHQPIRCLTMPELEAMAQNAISTLHRAGVAADGGKARRTRVAEALDAPGMTACAVCSRETRGFYYTHLLRPDRYPTFAFCSMRCLQAGAAIAKRNRRMIDKTARGRRRSRMPDAPRRGAERARPDGALPRSHRRGDRPHDRGGGDRLHREYAAPSRHTRADRHAFDDPIPF